MGTGAPKLLVFFELSHMYLKGAKFSHGYISCMCVYVKLKIILKMKQYPFFTLISFTLLFAVATNAYAQRISDLNISNAQALSGFVHSNPTIKGEEKISGKIEMVFLPSVDLSKLEITPVFFRNTKLPKGGKFPSDFTQPRQVELEMSSGGETLSSTYTIIMRKIKPASLPFELNFGKNFQAKSWQDNGDAYNGWAGACLEQNNYGIPKLTNLKHQLILSFSGEAKELGYSISFGTEVWPSENNFNVESSVDGMKWDLLYQYNSSNPMAGNKALKEDKIKTLALKSNVRFIRFIFSQRLGGGFVSLNNITIK